MMRWSGLLHYKEGKPASAVLQSIGIGISLLARVNQRTWVEIVYQDGE